MFRRPPLTHHPPRTGNTFPALGPSWPALIYLGIGLTQAFVFYCRSLLFTKASVRSGNRACACVMRMGTNCGSASCVAGGRGEGSEMESDR